MIRGRIVDAIGSGCMVASPVIKGIDPGRHQAAWKDQYSSVRTLFVCLILDGKARRSLSERCKPSMYQSIGGVSKILMQERNFSLVSYCSLLGGCSTGHWYLET